MAEPDETTQKYIDKTLKELVTTGVSGAHYGPQTITDFRQLTSSAMMRQVNLQHLGEGNNEHINLGVTNESEANALHALARIAAPTTFGEFMTVGVNINHQDKDGNAPLHMLNHEYVSTFHNSAAELLKMAVENGADLNLKNKEGVSVLDNITQIQAQLTSELAAQKDGIPKEVAKLKEASEENRGFLSSLLGDDFDEKAATAKLTAAHTKQAENFDAFINQSLPVKPDLDRSTVDASVDIPLLVTPNLKGLELRDVQQQEGHGISAATPAAGEQIQK